MTETQRTDRLIEALKARLDEDERLIAAVATSEGTDWRTSDLSDGVISETLNCEIVSGPFGLHADLRAYIARRDPKRELAIVAAHREILELHSPITTYECTTCYESWSTYPCPTIKALAKGYGIDVEP